jgi:hypothetical protein
MVNWAQILTIANFILLICGVLGGYIALRSAVANAEVGVQTRVREALSAENELLRNQIKRVEGEYKQLKSLMNLLIDTLKKQRNLDIEIEDDSITIRDGATIRVSRLPATIDTSASP